MSEGRKRGSLRRAWTVRCGLCQSYEIVGASSFAFQADAAVTAYGRGWGYTTRDGWLCPVCWKPQKIRTRTECPLPETKG